MMVNGPLEIYSTVIGAKLYDDIFNILVSFGVAFIPLLVLFFSNMGRFFETPFDHAASTSLRRVTFEVFLFVLSIMLFVAPTHVLDVTGITYKPACSANATTSVWGDTGTTYDNAFESLSYDNVRIPWGLAFVLMGASGITNAAIVSLPCKTDVQAIKDTIDTTRLTPTLTQQVKRFQTECYADARSQFDNQHPDESTYQTTMNHYGGFSDLSWVGSHVFQELYYPAIYPKAGPVPGFSATQYPYRYQALNEKSGVTTSEWGYPSCSVWWNDPDNGLESKLVELVNEHQPSDAHLGEVSLGTQVASWLAEVNRLTGSGSQITADDVITHHLLYDNTSESGFGRLYNGWMQNDALSGYGSSGLLNGVTQVAAQSEQGIKAASSALKRAEIAQEIPILQAVLLALCLALGPFILVLGNYRVHVIFTYYFIIASTISIVFVEKFIHYLELSLHASQSYGLYSLGNNFVMYNVFTNLYFYAPLIYLMLMSICGVQAGSALKGALGNSVSGGSGGISDLVVKSATKGVFK